MIGSQEAHEAALNQAFNVVTQLVCPTPPEGDVLEVQDALTKIFCDIQSSSDDNDSSKLKRSTIRDLLQHLCKLLEVEERQMEKPHMEEWQAIQVNQKDKDCTALLATALPVSQTSGRGCAPALLSERAVPIIFFCACTAHSVHHHYERADRLFEKIVTGTDSAVRKDVQRQAMILQNEGRVERGDQSSLEAVVEGVGRVLPGELSDNLLLYPFDMQVNDLAYTAARAHMKLGRIENDEKESFRSFERAEKLLRLVVLNRFADEYDWMCEPEKTDEDILNTKRDSRCLGRSFCFADFRKSLCSMDNNTGTTTRDFVLKTGQLGSIAWVVHELKTVMQTKNDKSIRESFHELVTDAAPRLSELAAVQKFKAEQYDTTGKNKEMSQELYVLAQDILVFVTEQLRAALTDPGEAERYAEAFDMMAVGAAARRVDGPAANAQAVEWLKKALKMLTAEDLLLHARPQDVADVQLELGCALLSSDDPQHAMKLLQCSEDTRRKSLEGGAEMKRKGGMLQDAMKECRRCLAANVNQDGEEINSTRPAIDDTGAGAACDVPLDSIKAQVSEQKGPLAERRIGTGVTVLNELLQEPEPEKAVSAASERQAERERAERMERAAERAEVRLLVAFSVSTCSCVIGVAIVGAAVLLKRG